MAATYAPQEKQYYDQLFAVVDKDNTGILPGQDAYPFLTSSNLPTGTLGEVWAIADPDNNGFLTKDGWYRAARLIGWLQKGGAKNVEENLVTRAGPYPTFDKGPPPPAQPAIQPQLTGQQIQPLSAHNTGSVAGLPPLTSADRAKFTRLFAGAGPSNGLVSGDKARDMFLKSNLGYDKLGQIWNLADTQERGSLDLTDFIIGMYLIQSCMANPALNLPATLPPGTYELASGGRVPPPKAPASPISKQHTGNAGKSFASPPTTSSFSTLPSTSSFGGPTRQMSGFAPPQQNQHWDVTPQAKATSDQFFSQLDPQNKGVIEGDVAVPFMLQSQLDENSLASIWDLADIRKEGKLTRDEFAVAMHLINAKLAGQDIPASLPNSLVPPSLRDAYGSGSQEVLNQQGPSSATKDLFDVFGDDEPATAPTPKATTPQPPQPSQAPAFPTTFLSQPPPPPARRMTAQSTGQKTLSPAPTGQQATSGFGMAPFGEWPLMECILFVAPAARGSDLLGDDAAEDKPSTVPDQSAEIGNKQNQLNNINRNLPDLEKTHQELETTATSSAAQLEELEAKLSSARARHEAETKAVADLRIRVGEQKERLRKLESEVISAESDLSAMRSEKDELEQGLLSDKEEIRGLQKMMKEVEEEKTGMKLVLEKLKKEARQQKGMLSIAKKQLSTAEGSRDTVQQDIRQTEREIEKDKAEIERASSSPPVPTPAHTSPQSQPRDMFSPSIAATVPLPATPQALSPAPTGTSTRSNNPFERLTGPRPAPPPPQPSQSQSRAVPTPPAREEEPTSPSFGVAALAGAGAAVTAAAGVVVAGAETLYDAAKEAVTSSPEAKSDTREDEVDPFGAPAPSATEDDKTPVPPAAGEEADPFGIPNATGAAQSTDPFGAPSTSTPTAASGFDDEDFDSGFGDSFNAASAAQSTQPTADLHLAPASEPEPSTGAPTDFDSAFADFDRPGPDVQDLAEGIPEGLPKSEIPAGLAARPEAERTLSTQAAAPESAPATPGIETPSKLYQGDFTRSAPPPSGLASEVYPQADEGESSDEEEGPEDLEGPKRGYGSKIEIGQDSTPFDEAGTQDETPAPVAPTSTGGSGVALAPPIPVGEEAIHKVRRSAPPPPSKATPSPAPVPAPVSQAGADEFDPFGAPAAPSSTTATTAVPDGSAPKTAAFDEDDFDFSDLPPAQVEQGQSQAQQGSSPAQGTTGGFDDEFAGFDDEFEKPDFGGNGGSDNSNSGSGSVSKGYEIVSPPTQRFDEWGFGGPGGHNQSQNQIQTHTQGHDAFSGQAGGVAPPASGSGFSFDDAFGGDFEPQPEAAGNQASSATQAYAPPPGPPPRQGQESQQQGNLQPPPMPERRPSGAQEDDIDQVKNLCAMGFSRGLVVEALAANGYDVQKALNVLLSA
ncbi:hypothetical protein I317_04540 [Kwoniella heveanensis CBS 569]|nr:hypothetical protein I317_04540 [Kwoniella heveanensis CBS 569]